MRRREVIGLIGATPVCLLAAAARAQQPALPTIGFLSSRSPEEAAHHLHAFREGLKEVGFIEGENVLIEYRWSPGRSAKSRRGRQGVPGEGQRRSADRPELGRLMRSLAPRVLVMRLDRLARSTRDLLNVLAAIAEKQASFRSLSDAWADTTTPHGRLMLTVLGGLAEFERELIRARTGEGRERAKARGVRLGRKPKLTPHQEREALARRDAGEPVTEIARSYDVHHAPISQLSSPWAGVKDGFGHRVSAGRVADGRRACITSALLMAGHA